MINLFNWLAAFLRPFTLACSDGPDPPDPDPLIGQAAKENSEVARRAITLSERAYEDNKPRQALIDQTLLDAVRSQQAIAEKNSAQGDEYYQYMMDTFRPVEQQLVDEAMTYDTPAEQQKQAIAAGADVQSQIDSGLEAFQRSRRLSGVSAASGNRGQAGRIDAIVGAAAKGGAMTRARDNVRAMGRAYRADAANMGRNLPSNAATAYGTSLNATNSAVQNSTVGAANARADMGMMNQGFNTAMSGWNSVGNLGVARGNAAMQAWQGQQQGQSDTWGAIGSIAGMALGGPMGGAIGGALFGQKAAADGGKIQGPGTGISDDIQAVNEDTGEAIRVSNGEYIIPADVVKAKGTEFFDRLVAKHHTPAAVQRKQGAIV